MGTNLELQEFLFSHRGNRAKLLEKTNEEFNGVEKTILIIRNHSFELIATAAIPYLAYSNIKPKFIYSDYDDSLSFKDIELKADLIILWLDLSRYSLDNLSTLILERIRFFVTNAKSPMLVATVLGEIDIEDLGVPHADFAAIQNELQARFIDKRLEKITGTQLSIEAQTRIALELGLQYVPTILGDKIKAIILDLDNTLYRGVLGEDGIHGVELTKGHKFLQDYIVQLGESGVLVCIATKNDLNDVQKLFEARNDFPLKFENFFMVEAGWMPKSQIIEKIQLATNTDPSSYLFVDDNLGEIFELENAEHRVRSVHAKDDAAETLFRIQHHPGVKKLNNETNEDLLRSTDLIANQKRQTLRQGLTKEQYLESLNIKLKIVENDMAQTNRISELFNKTNQFVFSYKRFTVPQIENLMSDSCYKVVSVSMSDNLSDSGIIACGVVALNAGEAEVLDLAVSCRALGRGLDEIIVLQLLKALIHDRQVNSITIPITVGPRNLPAQTFHVEYLENISIQQIDVFSAPEALIDVQFEK